LNVEEYVKNIDDKKNISGMDRVEEYVKNINDNRGLLHTRGPYSKFSLDKKACPEAEVTDAYLELTWGTEKATALLYEGMILIILQY
jgi:hypothetical protein